MKKIISFLLLLAILVTLPSTALALDLESDSLSEKLYISSYDCPTQYASFAEETVRLFLESSEFSELSPCYLGNAFTFSNSGSNVYYFPIYYSNRIICLLRVYSNEQGEISGVLSKGFASELNEIAPFTSITDPLNIYFNDMDVIFETASIRRSVFSYLTPQCVNEAITNDGMDLTRTTIECSADTAALILPSTAQLQSSNSTHYLDIFGSSGSPAETQGDGNYWCAAYAAAAIMRYKGMNGLYARDIMEYFYGSSVQQTDALTDNQIYTYATVQGFYTTITNSTLSYVDLCNEINYDRPVYIVMHRQVGTEHAYHAVVLCGYDDTSGMLRIWNPWYQYYETIYSLSNYVPAENRNRTYTYTKTIYNWA